MANEDSEEEDTLLLEKASLTTTTQQTNYERLVKGGAVLILVDILWVASAELSDFIFHNEGFDKPFFTTYFKTSAFVFYLPIVWLRSKWRQHSQKDSEKHVQSEEASCSNNRKELIDGSDCSFEDKHENIVYDDDDDDDDLQPVIPKLPLVNIMKIALLFCILWFLATLAYQEALAVTSPAAVNILSSSSGLFTLILAAIFQSSQTDRFSYSKLVAVIVSISGIVLVAFSDSHQTRGGINYGAFFSLGGAILYSCYLVLLKKQVPDEKQMDIATFFGFVGLFNILLLWPGFFLLHFTSIETFKMPNGWQVWCSLSVNALLGTALSEYLWLWGCYLTSSLSATMALGMVMPLTMLTDIIRGRVHLSLMFIIGSVPIFLSFFLITYLCHYDNWDPVRTCIVSLYHRCLCCFRRNSAPTYINSNVINQ